MKSCHLPKKKWRWSQGKARGGSWSLKFLKPNPPTAYFLVRPSLEVRVSFSHPDPLPQGWTPGKVSPTIKFSPVVHSKGEKKIKVRPSLMRAMGAWVRILPEKNEEETKLLAVVWIASSPELHLDRPSSFTLTVITFPLMWVELEPNSKSLLPR